MNQKVSTVSQHKPSAEDAAPSSEAQSALDRLRQNTPDVIKNNAPRVVSALKIAGSLAMVASKNWAFRTAGSCFIAGNLIMMAFGRKKTDEERERLQKEEAEKNAVRGDQHESFLLRHMRKVIQPHKYPLESGLTIFNLGSIFWLTAGAVGVKENRSKWYVIGGLLSLISDANGAFNKEKLDDADERANQGKTAATITYLKNRPVLASSLLNIGADVTTTVGGAIKYFKKQGEFKPMIAGGLILLANAFQAIYVNRNDYNIEKKQGVPNTPATSNPATASLAPITTAPDTKIASAREHETLHDMPQAISR